MKMKLKCPNCGNGDIRKIRADCTPELEKFWLDSQNDSSEEELLAYKNCGWFVSLDCFDSWKEWYEIVRQAISKTK